MARNIRLARVRGEAFDQVLAAYNYINLSRITPRLKDFKIDVDKVLKLKPLSDIKSFYGALFIQRGLYPVQLYFISPKYPALYEPYNTIMNEFTQLHKSTMTDVPVKVLGDILTHSEKWLQAHNITHSHFDAANLAPHEYTDNPPEAGYVYFILDPDKDQIKIGFSNDPESRLKSLQTGCPDARILCTFRTKDMRAEEYYYHAKFVADRRGTTEWFYPSEELLSFIESKSEESEVRCIVNVRN
jgi:hypothetical protein